MWNIGLILGSEHPSDLYCWYIHKNHHHKIFVHCRSFHINPLHLQTPICPLKSTYCHSQCRQLWALDLDRGRLNCRQIIFGRSILGESWEPLRRSNQVCPRQEFPSKPSVKTWLRHLAPLGNREPDYVILAQSPRRGDSLCRCRESNHMSGVSSI